MSEPKSVAEGIQEQVAKLGPGPLEEDFLVQFIHPLFSRVLKREEIYLANHSLGRPLDQTAIDVQQALDHWYQDLDGAWDHWLDEIQTFRGRVAQLIHAPQADCIIPKTSSGQGLRAILNCYDKKIQVVTTSAEFGSIDHILKVYAQRDRLELIQVGPDGHGVYHEEAILAAVSQKTSLVVLSMVLFTTGQHFTELAKLICDVQSRGAKVLVDLYHAAGAIPVDVDSLGVDFAIGGCYKYLRGGPGACWLYVDPHHLTGTLQTLDTGWFAQPKPFAFQRLKTPQFAEGGNAFLESTPPILPYYQAKAGLEFTLAVGVERLRAYSLNLQARLIEILGNHNLQPIGDSNRRGAFLAISETSADSIATQLREHKIIVDARDGLIRICPDVLSTEKEIVAGAEKLANIIPR